MGTKDNIHFGKAAGVNWKHDPSFAGKTKYYLCVAPVIFRTLLEVVHNKKTT